MDPTSTPPLGRFEMRLAAADWTIIALGFMITLALGAWAARRAGRDTTEYFLSGRDMPWWLLGVSMVATTFSTDTPNLVTDIVRQNGVAGNWVWWAFLLTGMLTVFIYARLWRRAGVATDLEFYELRYSGRGAAFLRAFRALYLGVFFNVMIMAAVTLAAIKIAGVMLGVSPLATVIIAGGVTALFSMLGGLRGIVITDFLLFFLAMVGSIAAAIIAVRHPDVGGLDALLAHPEVAGKLAFFPELTDTDLFVPLLILPLAVQWWSVWYPGSEPGGGGYIAQRMLSARDEGGATAATLLFNIAHYALRPWPWIIVALASIIVFPTVDSIREAFPGISESILGHDLAYPAMLTLLPTGLLGLVIASLAAAYMSTISTHLNWGASYFVNDFWHRFVEPDADERRLVTIGRVMTLVLMTLAAGVALWLENALQAFQILLQIGAGTGLLFILRWFWWRINVASELTAMTVSFIIAVYLELLHPRLFPLLALSSTTKLLLGVGITTITWVGATFIGRPAARETLADFYQLTRPGGPGWREIAQRVAASTGIDDGGPGTAPAWEVPRGILTMLVGSVAIYSALFTIGYTIYGEYRRALLVGILSLMGFILLTRIWKTIAISPVAVPASRDTLTPGSEP